MSAALLLAVWAAAADAPAPLIRPDGDPPAHGSQRLGVEAARFAHSHFSGDACVAAVDVLAFRAPDPKRPAQDQFSFSFRSPALNRMRFEVRVCLPHAAEPGDPRCRGEWEFEQSRKEAPPRCLSGRQADSGEALLIAQKNGLPKAPVDGLRMALRPVAKSGKGLARQPKLKGKNVWILEARDQCHAIDAQSLQLLFKGNCSALSWPD